jgi:hypothetical protein
MNASPQAITNDLYNYIIIFSFAVARAAAKGQEMRSCANIRICFPQTLL